MTINFSFTPFNLQDFCSKQLITEQSHNIQNTKRYNSGCNIYRDFIDQIKTSIAQKFSLHINNVQLTGFYPPNVWDLHQNGNDYTVIIRNRTPQLLLLKITNDSDQTLRVVICENEYFISQLIIQLTGIKKRLTKYIDLQYNGESINPYIPIWKAIQKSKYEHIINSTHYMNITIK